jgi:hypothetical protein
MRKPTYLSTPVSQRAQTAAGWEDSIDRALASMLTSEDPVHRAIAARLLVGDLVPPRRHGRLH